MTVFVSSLVVDEIKKIVKDSEIMKYVCYLGISWGYSADGSQGGRRKMANEK